MRARRINNDMAAHSVTPATGRPVRAKLQARRDAFANTAGLRFISLCYFFIFIFWPRVFTEAEKWKRRRSSQSQAFDWVAESWRHHGASFLHLPFAPALFDKRDNWWRPAGIYRTTRCPWTLALFGSPNQTASCCWGEHSNNEVVPLLAASGCSPPLLLLSKQLIK